MQAHMLSRGPMKAWELPFPIVPQVRPSCGQCGCIIETCIVGSQHMSKTHLVRLSATQLSEGMHSFFDGFVNSKTTLKQFIGQYENALRGKAENENMADFKSFKSTIPGITHYDKDKQFQSAYLYISKTRGFSRKTDRPRHQ